MFAQKLFIITIIFLLEIYCAPAATAQDSWNVRFVGGIYYWDFAFDVSVSGNYAYFADRNAGLRIVDISDPNNPVMTGGINLPDMAQGIDVQGEYAYVADDDRGGLIIINISNPVMPFIVSSCPTPDDAYGVDVSGNYAYVAADGAGLMVIDISNPLNPDSVSNCLFSPPAPARAVTVRGNYAYVATGHLGLRIIDITNPNNPIEIGWCDTPWDAYNIALSGDYAYVADGGGPWSGLITVDITNITSPQPIDTIPGSFYDVIVSGNYLFAAGRGLRVFDITGPAAPEQLADHDIPGTTWGLAVYNDYVCAATDEEYGLHMIDVSNPSIPFTASRRGFIGGISDFYALDNYVYVLDGWTGQPTRLRIYDVTDKSLPALVGTIEIAGGGSALDVSGSYAYLGGTNKLKIIDVADPVIPLEISECTVSVRANNLVMSGNYAYLTDDVQSLIAVVDVSDPYAPEERGTCELTRADEIAVYGNYALVTSSFTDYLYIVDVSDPWNPAVADSIIFSGSLEDVEIYDNIAYVARFYFGFYALNISNPLQPVIEGEYKTDGSAECIAVSDGYAFVGDGDEGIRVINIKDHAHMFETGYYKTPDEPEKIIATDQIAFVKDRFYRNIGIYDYSETTAVSELEGTSLPLPELAVLEAAHPNPFNPITKIKYDLTEDTNVNLQVFNVLGRSIVTLFKGYQAAGSYSIYWHGKDSNDALVSSGVYIVMLKTNSVSKCQKVTLIR